MDVKVIQIPPICPYCGAAAELADGSDIYPHRPDLGHLRFWLCASCRAWVGCHKGTKTPLGRLADAALRVAKQAAHSALDPLWQSGVATRGETYAWLARQMRLPEAEAHIGMFDLEQCREVVRICALPRDWPPRKSGRRVRRSGSTVRS